MRAAGRHGAASRQHDCGRRDRPRDAGLLLYHVRPDDQQVQAIEAPREQFLDLGLSRQAGRAKDGTVVGEADEAGVEGGVPEGAQQQTVVDVQPSFILCC